MIRQVKVAELQIGDVMGRDVVNRHGQVLLNAGAKIEGRHCSLLKSWGVLEVSVREPSSAPPSAPAQASDVALDGRESARSLVGEHAAVLEMARVVAELRATPDGGTEPAAVVGSDRLAQPPLAVSPAWRRLTAENVTARAGALASLPSIYLRVSTVINRPSSSTSDIAEALTHDQSLAARLLRIANSAFYRFPRRIETVSEAVRIMGTRQLHDMVLATIVLKQFRGIDTELVSMAEFWRHSLACGIMARQTAVLLRESNVERFFLAGLLHDIGSLVIYQKFPERACVILDKHRREDASIEELEREILGCDHAAVGKALLTEWRLPAFLRDIVAEHHSLEPKTLTLGLSAVHVADVFTLALGLGANGEARPSSLQRHAWDMLGLDISTLAPLAADTIRLLEEAERLFLSKEEKP